MTLARSRDLSSPFALPDAMKVLSPTAYGVVDYLTVGLFALAPFLFDFPGACATACYGLAAGYAVVTLLTEFPPARLRVLPFLVHGWRELFSGLALLAVPFLLDFGSAAARTFFLAMGGTFVLVWFLTDWRADTPAAHNGRMPSAV